MHHISYSVDGMLFRHTLALEDEDDIVPFALNQVLSVRAQIVLPIQGQ